jgi:hypothetical protein
MVQYSRGIGVPYDTLGSIEEFLSIACNELFDAYHCRPPKDSAEVQAWMNDHYKKTCGTCVFADGGVCTRPGNEIGEITTGFYCDDYQNILLYPPHKSTCTGCASRSTCEFVDDPYNTDGDCLANK